MSFYNRKIKKTFQNQVLSLDTEIEGIVENIIYRSDDTGYTVCSVRIDKLSQPITVVGKCSILWAGETIKASGHWTKHAKHGNQFEADTMVCIAPTSVQGIQKFLASGLVKGIGPEMAERIVKKFGTNTLLIIEKDSGRLEEVDGIGPHRRKMIKESWNELQGVREVMIFLQSHGIGITQATRIYKQYGPKAISMISENPYRLCREIWGIGFKKADKVAASMGIPNDSMIRARAGISYTLQVLAEEGHCFDTESELLLKANELLGIPVEKLYQAVNEEIKEGNVIKEDDRIYLKHLFIAEKFAASRLADIIRAPENFKPIDAEKAIPWAQERMGIQFSFHQQLAIKMALSNKVSMITGGPGVGKTTILRALVDIFNTRKLKVCLAAPTGRAAKRMEEATGHPAKTIHRMLGYQPGFRGFEYNYNNRLDGDIFAIDEMSMIDIELFYSLLSALPDRAHLIMVGDPDQLPSIGAGNVLKDLILSEKIPVCKLETIFRQEEGGWIVQNAHAVNNGKNLILPENRENSDFFFIECNDPERIIATVRTLVSSRIPEKFGFDPLTEIQVLTPMRKNVLGAENLNIILQETLNPTGASMERYGRTYRIRDRVMQIVNNYDKGVFNGDIGRIIDINNTDQKLTVDFDGNYTDYSFAEIDELAHAYACSIHKSQGSEYPAVIILITTQHYKLLQRNLLYTAITRGKKLVCVIGSSKAIFLAIRNNKIHERKTTLARRLSLLMQHSS